MRGSQQSDIGCSEMKEEMKRGDVWLSPNLETDVLFVSTGDQALQQAHGGASCYLPGQHGARGLSRGGIDNHPCSQSVI